MVDDYNSDDDDGSRTYPIWLKGIFLFYRVDYGDDRDELTFLASPGNRAISVGYNMFSLRKYWAALVVMQLSSK